RVLPRLGDAAALHVEDDDLRRLVRLAVALGRRAVEAGHVLVVADHVVDVDGDVAAGQLGELPVVLDGGLAAVLVAGARPAPWAACTPTPGTRWRRPPSPGSCAASAPRPPPWVPSRGWPMPPSRRPRSPAAWSPTAPASNGGRSRPVATR